jgi:carbamoyl-phosphate synthase large subunit
VELYGTHGTAAFLAGSGIPVVSVNWPLEESSDGATNALELIRERAIDLVVNIPKDASEEELTNDYMIRRAAVDYGVPLVTNIQLAERLAWAIGRKTLEDLETRSWEEY